MSAELDLKNVLFKPLQPYELLPALLNIADCHLVVQKKGAADAVLPSKLTNILAIGGNSVITAEESTELGQLCKIILVSHNVLSLNLLMLSFLVLKNVC